MPSYPAITNYHWDMGDGTTYSGAALDNVNHQYAADGLYTVTLTITNANSDTFVKTYPVEVEKSYAPITSYDWDFGDGKTDNGQNVNHRFNNDGMFDVELTVTNSDGETFTQTFVMDVKKSYPTVSYSWDFGDGQTGTGDDVNHSYLVDGWYTVTLDAVDSEGNTDQRTTQLIYTQNQLYTAKWDFGDGTTGKGLNVNHSYMPGTYDVTLRTRSYNGQKGSVVEQDYIVVEGFEVSASPEEGIAPLKVSFRAD